MTQQELTLKLAKDVFNYAAEMENLLWKDGEYIYELAVNEQIELLEIIKNTTELLPWFKAEKETLNSWLNFKGKIINWINHNLKNWIDEKYGFENVKN